MRLSFLRQRFVEQPIGNSHARREIARFSEHLLARMRKLIVCLVLRKLKRALDIGET